jgi:hypothetical protein
MKPPNNKEEDYVDLLIATQNAYSSTEEAQVLLTKGFHMMPF